MLMNLRCVIMAASLLRKPPFARRTGVARSSLPMPTIAMVRKAPLDDYVVETLMPDLIGHARSPSAFIVYVKLWHDAGGAEGRVQASLSTLAVETGLSK